MLLALDVFGFAALYAIAYTIRMQAFDAQAVFSGSVFAFALINILCLYLFDLYSLDPQATMWKKPIQALAAALIAGCVIVVLAYLGGAIEFRGGFGRGVLIGAQGLFAIWAGLNRAWINRWFRKATRRARWLVIGTEENLKPFIHELIHSRLTGTYVCLTDGERDFGIEASSQGGLTFKHAGQWSKLGEMVSEPWAGIIIGTGNNLPEEMVEILMDRRLTGLRVVDLIDFYEQVWFKVPVFYVQRSWFAMSQGFQLLHNPIGLKLKRVFDVLGATLLFFLTLPLVALAMIAVKIESRGPVIYKQTRVGQNGRLFTVLKLRSMRTDAEATGAQWTEVGDKRITRVGKFIRATRLDELPQLVNVIRGDMSFIGPRPERPELMKDLEEAIPFYNLRHLLRPGITGWAQVMYRYGASVEDALQKLQYELYYIKNYSLLLDIAITLKTIRVVLFGQGR